MLEFGTTQWAIVADIGGTFARFARVNLHTLALDAIEIYPCARFTSLEMALRTYQQQFSLTGVTKLAIAIACPVLSDQVTMTNCQWSFSIAELKRSMRLEELSVINDFSAIANSLTALKPSDLYLLGAAAVDQRKAKVVLGAGTGLGVALVIPTDKAVRVIAGAGGHVEWPVTNEQEWIIFQYLNKKYGHVSQERVLSGQGLEDLYAALTPLYDTSLPQLKAAEIIHAALSNSDAIAMAAVDQFLASLGTCAGDLALTAEAFGGVYLAGGIVPRLLPIIAQSRFRQRFEAKGRFSDFNKKIATFVITVEQPGLLGAAVYLRHSVQGVVDVVF